MRWFSALLVPVVLTLGVAPAHGDVNDLSGGVLILHAEPSIEWTNYCHLWPYHGIDSCAQQVNRIDCPADQDFLTLALHVLLGWTEPKQFRQVEFGLGQFDDLSYIMWPYFTEACFRGTGTEVATAGWPGPNEGVVLTATDVPWSGSLEHVYVMAVYAYCYPEPPSPTIIPLAPHPVSGFGGAVNCLDPPQAYPAECFGGVGIGTDGLFCCPGGVSSVPEDPAPQPTWGSLKNLYR
jgi:hypothetical protein